MSVEPVHRKSGRVWRVRWRDETGAARSKVLGRKADAVHFDAEVRRRKRLGELVTLDPVTMNELVERWWELYAVPHLALDTRKSYASLWNNHARSIFGPLVCSHVTPEHGDELVAALKEKGLAPATINKTLVVVSAVMEWAAIRGYVRANPIRQVKKPSATPERPGRALSIAEIEALRGELDLRGQTIVSLIAYGGLRPSELRKMPAENARGGVLRVTKEIAKYRTPPRRVDLPEPVAEEIESWLVSTGSEWLLPAARGGPTSANNWRLWQRRHFAPAAERAGQEGLIPYDLRHSFVSHLIQAGMSILEVARVAGHKPTMTLETYGHLIEDYDPAERLDVSAEIVRVRKVSVSETRAA